MILTCSIAAISIQNGYRQNAPIVIFQDFCWLALRYPEKYPLKFVESWFNKKIFFLLFQNVFHCSFIDLFVSKLLFTPSFHLSNPCIVNHAHVEYFYFFCLLYRLKSVSHQNHLMDHFCNKIENGIKEVKKVKKVLESKPFRINNRKSIKARYTSSKQEQKSELVYYWLSVRHMASMCWKFHRFPARKTLCGISHSLEIYTFLILISYILLHNRTRSCNVISFTASRYWYFSHPIFVRFYQVLVLFTLIN